MKKAILEFEEYPGEEVAVQVSGVPLAVFLDIREKLNVLRYDEAEFTALAEAFQPFLLSWTFDEAIEGGLFAHHIGLGIGIVREWIKAVRDVPLPLSRTSTDGTPSVDSPEQD